MILEPDFFNHWKILALVELTGFPESPLWIQRLWAHCQTRRTDTFNLPPIALKVICGVTTKKLTPDRWFQILTECGFIEGEPGNWKVHDWAKHNAALVKNWVNGDKPKTKKPDSGSSQTEANGKPTASQEGAKAEPKGVSLTLGPSDGLDGLDGLDGKDRKDTIGGAGSSQGGERGQLPVYDTGIERELSRTFPPILAAIPGWLTLWGDWLRYVSEKQHGLPPEQTLFTHLKILHGIAAAGGDAAVKASLENAMARGYRAPLDPKNNLSGGGAPEANQPSHSSVSFLPPGFDPYAGGPFEKPQVTL